MRRGPDSYRSYSIVVDTSHEYAPAQEPITICVFSTVLALRGDHVQAQPLQAEDDRSFLCWNGEAWQYHDEVISGNDAEHVFKRLSSVSTTNETLSANCITEVIAGIAGPFAFVYFDARSQQLFYGRDRIGRRSLLFKPLPDGGLALCSIAENSTFSAWEEVEVGGIEVLKLASLQLDHEHLPWPSKFPSINLSLPPSPMETPDVSPSTVNKLHQYLLSSLHRRVVNVPPTVFGPSCLTGQVRRIGILFSGGLDCTLLARLAHEQLPLSEPIDLLNVAFENPRSPAASEQGTNLYELCPDRKTGRASWHQLYHICPGREWRFVAINVSFSESQQERDTVVRLMAPHNTEMDLSIALALYFAARGRGEVMLDTSQMTYQYETQAQVLLSGLGADELFAGYTRHATAAGRGGLQALLRELELDFQRLGQRNLGRDDRVISHWSKEVRYPYLDEDLVSWALNLPVWEKCGFRSNSLQPQPDTQPDEAVSSCGPIGLSEIMLEPAKKLLRLLALRLDMREVANERKRAIQFGARTAKMHLTKKRCQTKGTDPVFLAQHR